MLICVSFYLSHVRSLLWICGISLSNCEIWLQIKQNLDVSLTLDAGNRKVCLKFEGIPFDFVIRLNMQIAAVQCYFTAKTRDSSSAVGQNRHIYDFLLVINCQLSYISHRFLDIASRSPKLLHPRLSPRSSG